METTLEKFVVVIAAFLILFLFISGLSPLITGNIIYSDDFDLKDYPYPFIKNNVYNSLYIVVPEIPTNAELRAANAVGSGLKSSRPLMPKIIPPSRLPSGPANIIAIGSPSRNPLVAKYLSEEPAPSTGVIELVKENSGNVLAVSASSEVTLVKTAEILKYYYSQPLDGTRITLSGGSLLFE